MNEKQVPNKILKKAISNNFSLKSNQQRKNERTFIFFSLISVNNHHNFFWHSPFIEESFEPYHYPLMKPKTALQTEIIK